MEQSEYQRQFSLENLKPVKNVAIPLLSRDTALRRVPEEYQSEYYREFADPATKIRTQKENKTKRNAALPIIKDLPIAAKSNGNDSHLSRENGQQAKTDNNETKIISEIIRNTSKEAINSNDEKSLDQKPPMAQYGTGNTNPAVPSLYMKTFNVNPPLSEVINI